MDLQPKLPKRLIGEGRYDAFPMIAANGNVVCALWRSAKPNGHVADVTARIKGAMSTDGGATYGKVFTVAWDDGDALTEVSPSGLAWDATRSKWVCVVLVKRFPDTTYRGPKYEAVIITSTDGMVWSKAADVRFGVSGFAFVSGISIDSGRWLVSAYGAVVPDAKWTVMTVASTDGGASWTAPSTPVGAPDVQLAEPQVTRLASGSWLMAARCDELMTVHLFQSDDGVSWTFKSAPLGGVSGAPTIAQASDGTLVMLLRGRPTVDGTHGRWLWASSDDDGESWALHAFPSAGYMMYGGLVAVGDDLACVFAAEDDPDRLWESASVYSTVFASTPLVAQERVVDGVFCIEILGGGLTGRVTRVTQDPRTGLDVIDQVRVRLLSGDGGARDFELQQGRVARYYVDDRAAAPVVGPILPEAWFIHPTKPSLSVPVTIVSDGERDYPADVALTQVPSTARWGDQTTVMRSSGRLGAATGSTVIRTSTEIDEYRLRDCLGDLTPIFWSHHPGLRMPEWIGVTSVKSTRVVQICPCGCGHRLDNVGHWRHWTIEWVEQARPDVDAMPYRYRIEEVDSPIMALPIPIREV